MSDKPCVYCTGLASDSADGSRTRPDTHTLQKCGTCGGYQLAHANGRTFALTDRNDPDSDATTRRPG